jgi:hypothetical protein
MHVWLNHSVIAIPERLLREITLVAVVVVGHVGIYVSLIVIQINRLGLTIVRREVAMMIGRTPYRVVASTKSIPQRRTLNEYRTYDIVVSIQVLITYNLYV